MSGKLGHDLQQESQVQESVCVHMSAQVRVRVSHRHQAVIREDCTTQYSHCLTLLPTAYMFTLWACCAPYRPEFSALAGGNHPVLGTGGTGKQARMVLLSTLLSHAPSMQGLRAVHETRTCWAESVSLICLFLRSPEQDSCTLQELKILVYRCTVLNKSVCSMDLLRPLNAQGAEMC